MENANSRKNVKNTKIIVTVILALLVVVFGAISGEYMDIFPTDDSDNNLVVEDYPFSVHFIDVGQGDCILIKSDDGNMLIDAGENGYENEILTYLSDLGVEDITYFVATHPHSDHIGGAAEIISNLTVQNVIMPRLSVSNTPTTKTYENMLNSIKQSEAKVIAAKPGQTYSFGEVSFIVLSPYEQDNDLNNMSVSVRLSYKGYSFMFTGDAEKQVEKQMLASGYDLSADVYKLAHHGSTTSNTYDFFEAVSPDYAVISCSYDNEYGHPHDEIIQMLDDSGTQYYKTYESGTIIFIVDDNGISVKTKK